MDDATAWKLINLLLGAVLGLVAMVVRHIWHKLETVTEKVHKMELDAVGTLVTKPMLEKAFHDLVKDHIEPLNRDIGRLIHALTVQGIHIDHSR